MFERIGGPQPVHNLAFAPAPTGAQLPSRAVAGAAGAATADPGRGSSGRDASASHAGLAGQSGDAWRMAAFLSSLADPDAPTGPQPTFERTYLEAVAERRRQQTRTSRDDAAPAPADPARGPRGPQPGHAPGATPQSAPPAKVAEPVSLATATRDGGPEAAHASRIGSSTTQPAPAAAMPGPATLNLLR
jgi:hypothetical protein